MVPTSGEGEYGLEDPVDSLRPTAWAGSAGTGEHEPIFMNPMGLVLERLTTPALGEPWGLDTGLAVEERFCSMRW